MTRDEIHNTGAELNKLYDEVKSGQMAQSDVRECFVIMPISDQPNYPPDHFTRVYRDIIVPACVNAGYKPDRADEKLGTNIIHHEIIKQLLNAPMAICDLSSRNPNVMFELGLRQAFDKPVVLIQDENTPQIFDVNVLRSINYRSAKLYNEAVEDQIKITSAIEATARQYESGSSANSLIKLLQIEKAVFDQPTSDDPDRAAIQILQSQIETLNNVMMRFMKNQESRDYQIERSLVSAGNINREIRSERLYGVPMPISTAVFTNLPDKKKIDVLNSISISSANILSRFLMNEDIEKKEIIKIIGEESGIPISSASKIVNTALNEAREAIKSLEND